MFGQTPNQNDTVLKSWPTSVTFYYLFTFAKYNPATDATVTLYSFLLWDIFCLARTLE